MYHQRIEYALLKVLWIVYGFYVMQRMAAAVTVVVAAAVVMDMVVNGMILLPKWIQFFVFASPIHQ